MASIVKIRETAVEQRQKVTKDLGPFYSHFTTAMMDRLMHGLGSTLGFRMLPGTPTHRHTASEKPHSGNEVFSFD